MKRICILTRNELVKRSKLKNIDEIEMEDFSVFAKGQLNEHDIILFHCSLLNKVLVLKNRYSKCQRIFDDESMINFADLILSSEN